MAKPLIGMGPLGSTVGRLATRHTVFILALNTAEIITAMISTASGLEGTGPGGRRTAKDVRENTKRNFADLGNFLFENLIRDNPVAQEFRTAVSPVRLSGARTTPDIQFTGLPPSPRFSGNVRAAEDFARRVT